MSQSSIHSGCCKRQGCARRFGKEPGHRRHSPEESIDKMCLILCYACHTCSGIGRKQLAGPKGQKAELKKFRDYQEKISGNTREEYWEDISEVSHLQVRHSCPKTFKAEAKRELEM